MVTVSWTLLENIMQSSVYAITEDNSPERAQYDKTRSFQIRLDLWEALAAQKLKPPHDARFKVIVISVRDAQLLRDRIVHGSWGDDGKPVLGEEARGAFNWLKPHPPFEWKLDFGAIRAVAERIDQLVQAWVHAALDGEPKGPDILMSDALKRKLRSPSPTS